MSSDPADQSLTDCIISARHNLALIRNWANAFTYDELSADVMRFYAIMYAFISLSEAIEDIPQKNLLSYAPAGLWQKIKSFRNMLAHTYDDMPDWRIMETINNSLPELDTLLERMLKDLTAAR